jgi:very-short-patch-repair endonuclease
VVAPAQKTARRFPFPPPASAWTVVDFFCPAAKLAIEVDGGQHADDGEARARWLEARGYRVIRFWNNDVLANTEGALHMILDALRADLPP